MFAYFADGLFRIHNQIQEDLRQLVGIAKDGWKVRTHYEVHLHVIGSQRMFVELDRTLKQIGQVQQGIARRGGVRKHQQAFHNMRGASGLAVGEIELAARILVFGLIADHFRDAQDGRQRVVQLVRDSGNHLAHGSEPFGLDQLLL